MTRSILTPDPGASRGDKTPPQTRPEAPSTDYRARLHAVIPGGAHTYSRGDDQYASNAPPILERGQGAYVWDPAGTRYLDYGMALRAVTLGYAHPAVNAAAIEGIGRGVNLTRATTLELEAAEAIVATIPGAEMVKFAKNGSNSTTAAIKIARAYTGRRYVCVPRQHPFFSFDDWFIGSTAVKRGIPADHYATTLTFDYGNLASLRALFGQHPGEIAAVIMEPATTVFPCPPECECARPRRGEPLGCRTREGNFLHQARRLCTENGTLLILDEMITGFRMHREGGQKFFGVEPDMSTFGKGMANGFSVSAIVGKREFMRVGSTDVPGMERTFLLSTTYGAEMPGMAAFLATLRVYSTEDVVGHLWSYGRDLFEGVNSISGELGIGDRFAMDGSYIAMNVTARDTAGQVSPAFRTLFAQEMAARGILIPPWIAISYAHGQTELDMTLQAAREALVVYRAALTDGVDRFLRGPVVQPVFRKYN